MIIKFWDATIKRNKEKLTEEETNEEIKQLQSELQILKD